MKQPEYLFLDGLIFLMNPPLIPGLLPVQDKEKVLKLGKTELLPLYLTGIILLEHRQYQRLLFFLQPPQSQTRQGLASGKAFAPEVILPFIECILVRIVSDPELAQKNSDDV